MKYNWGEFWKWFFIVFGAVFGAQAIVPQIVYNLNKLPGSAPTATEGDFNFFIVAVGVIGGLVVGGVVGWTNRDQP
jgi:hypothetical protein